MVIGQDKFSRCTRSDTEKEPDSPLNTRVTFGIAPAVTFQRQTSTDSIIVRVSESRKGGRNGGRMRVG